MSRRIPSRFLVLAAAVAVLSLSSSDSTGATRDGSGAAEPTARAPLHRPLDSCGGSADAEIRAGLELAQAPPANACCAASAPCALQQPMPVGYQCACYTPYGWVPGVSCRI